MSNNGEVRIKFRADGNEVLVGAMRDAQERLLEMREAGIKTDEQMKEYRKTLREAIMAKRDLKREIEITNEGFYSSVRILQDVGQMFRMVSGMITQYNVAQIRIAEANKNVIDSQKQLEEAQARYNEIMSQTFETSKEYASAIEDVNRAMSSVNEATERVKEAEENLARVQEEAGAEAARKIAQAQDEYNRVLERTQRLTEDLARANISRERTELRIKELQERLNKLAAGGKEHTDAYKKAILDLEEAKLDLADIDERIAKLTDEQNKKDQTLAEAQKELAEATAKAEEKRIEKINKAKEQVTKAKEEEQKAQEKLTKAQQDLLAKQSEWEKKHAEDVKKASDDIFKARERVEEANRRLERAQNTLNTQMLTFAFYGIPQVLTGLGKLNTDIIVAGGNLGKFATEGIGILVRNIALVPHALSSFLITPIGLAVVAVGASLLALKVAWDNNLGGIQEKVKGAVEVIKGLWDGMMGFLKNVWEEAKPFVFDAMGGAIESISRAVGELWGKYLKPFIDWIAPVVQTVFRILLLGILGEIALAFKGLGIVVNSTWNTFKGFLDFLTGAINVIKGVIGWLGSLISSANQAKSATSSVNAPKPSYEQAMGERQYGGLIPVTGTYKLEKGEVVLSQNMLADLVSYSRRFAEISPQGAGVGGKVTEININSPLIRVEGHMDEKLAKEVSKYVLREIRRVVSV